MFANWVIGVVNNILPNILPAARWRSAFDSHDGAHVAAYHEQGFRLSHKLCRAGNGLFDESKRDFPTTGDPWADFRWACERHYSNNKIKDAGWLGFGFDVLSKKPDGIKTTAGHHWLVVGR